MGRRSIIVIEDFYQDPAAVRDYALRQTFYNPYTKNGGSVGNAEDDIRYWNTSWYKGFNECPFKSSDFLVTSLEEAVGEKIDMDSWKARYPVNNRSKPLQNKPEARATCLWNCSFHVKFDTGQKVGGGVHNHVTDTWNSVGTDGWAGLLYLSEDAPVDGGLHLWRNIDPANTFDWMSSSENWVHLDQFANISNRLILVRGDIPHSGSNGWGNNFETGRLFQTFFFRTAATPSTIVVNRDELNL